MARTNELTLSRHMKIMTAVILFGLAFSFFFGAYVAPIIGERLGWFIGEISLLVGVLVAVFPTAYYLRVYLPPRRPK